MLKKILIAIGVLVVLGVIGIVFIGNKIDSKIKEKEPEFRQYVAMTTEDQNAYVQKHFYEIFSFIRDDQSDKEESIRDKASLQQMENDPAAMQAQLAMGRSLVAMFILDNDNIKKDLTPEQIAAFQAEADQFDANTDKYNDYIEKYFPQSKEE